MLWEGKGEEKQICITWARKKFPDISGKMGTKKEAGKRPCSHFFVSYWKNGFYFATLLEGQISLKKHWAHLGLRAEQIRRPWKISQWCASFQIFRSNKSHSCFSVSSTSLASTRPIRLETRNTWVSTANPGISKALLNASLAVFRPTPGRVVSSSNVWGSSPPNFST